MIGKISELLVSGNCAAFLEVATSPKSPLELKIHSPKGVKNYELGGGVGVGLGIVAALDKSGDVGGTEILARHAMYSPRPIRTDPIPVSHVKNCCRNGAYNEEPSHGLKNECRKSKKASIFCVAPARCPEDTTTAFLTSDFLSSCHLCMKKLHGKDIYMYRGEKAFCSTECRERQIMIDDDRKKQCRTESTRSVDVSSSPYVFSTGILAI